jgi:hypothetical protein
MEDVSFQRPSRQDREKVKQQAKYLKTKHGWNGSPYKAFVAQKSTEGFVFKSTRNPDEGIGKGAANPARREPSNHPEAVKSRRKRQRARVQSMVRPSTAPPVRQVMGLSWDHVNLLNMIASSQESNCFG